MQTQTEEQRSDVPQQPNKKHAMVNSNLEPMKFQRVEKKIPLDLFQCEEIRQLLGTQLDRNSAFPEGWINSIYFDTPDLHHYYETFDGMLRRKKIRLRWYGQPQGDEWVTAYLELKEKEGFIGRKVREKITLPTWLLQWPNVSTLSERREIRDKLFDISADSGALLSPKIMISYFRHRFDDRNNSAQVAVDSHISSRMLDAAVAPHRRSKNAAGWGNRDQDRQPGIIGRDPS